MEGAAGEWLGWRSSSAVDLVVFDDVGPVGDDPLVACVLLPEGFSQEVVGVVDAELAGRELRDDGANVGGQVAKKSSSCRSRSWRVSNEGTMPGRMVRRLVSASQSRVSARCAANAS